MVTGLRSRAFSTVIAATFLLSACAGGSKALISTPGEEMSLESASGRTIGIVAADEPRAAIVARDVLEHGGSVGDAATALYFTLAVTYPVAAGIGGGGVCLHYDAETKSATSIDFLPRAARGGGAVAVPGAVRGFAYIHARFGKLAWAEVVSPAERYAALGHPMSRALATAVAAHEDTVRANPFLSNLFVRADGQLKREGEKITQVALAGTLALVRGRGPIGFYGGSFATSVAQAADANGGHLLPMDLHDYRPEAAPARPIEVRNRMVLAPAERTGAGALSDAVLPALAAAVGKKPPPGTVPAAATHAVDTALAGFGISALPPDFGSTGFVVADRKGNAMACGVTLSRPFGTAADPARAGFAFAPSPATGADGLAGAFLMPLIVTAPPRSDVIFAGVGAGGRTAASTVSALAYLAAIHKEDRLPLTLKSSENGPGNTVNALACGDGLVTRLQSCIISADPRAHGIAARGSEQKEGGFLGVF